MDRNRLRPGPRRDPGAAALRLAAFALCLAGCAKSEDAWRADLDDPDPFVRGLAAIAIAQIAPERSGDAVVDLVQVATGAQRALREPARRGLARIGGRDPWALIETLRGGVLEPRGRTMVAETLALVGEPAIEPLARAMEDPGQSNARELGLVLVAIGEPAVPALAARLESEYPVATSAAAAWMLGRIGPEASAALPALLGAVDGAPAHVARLAVESAQRIDPAGELSMPRLLAAARRDDALVAEAARTALARVHLVRGAAGDERERAQHAREVLAFGEDAWPALVEAIDGRDAERSGYASLLLLASTAHFPLGVGAADPGWKEYLELGHDQAFIRAETLLRIARAGAGARAALPLVAGATKDRSAAVRLCALWAFRCVAPRAVVRR